MKNALVMRLVLIDCRAVREESGRTATALAIAWLDTRFSSSLAQIHGSLSGEGVVWQENRTTGMWGSRRRNRYLGRHQRADHVTCALTMAHQRRCL